MATGAGPFGFEVDFGYSPKLLRELRLDERIPVHQQEQRHDVDGQTSWWVSNKGGVRPYIVGGVGLIRTNVDDIGSVFDVNTKNDFGLDVGGRA